MTTKPLPIVGGVTFQGIAYVTFLKSFESGEAFCQKK